MLGCAKRLAYTQAGGRDMKAVAKPARFCQKRAAVVDAALTMLVRAVGPDSWLWLCALHGRRLRSIASIAAKRYRQGPGG